jgi:hypothetical protein
MKLISMPMFRVPKVDNFWGNASIGATFVDDVFMCPSFSPEDFSASRKDSIILKTFDQAISKSILNPDEIFLRTLILKATFDQTLRLSNSLDAVPNNRLSFEARPRC